MHANEERTNCGRGLTRWEMNAFWAMSALGGALLAVLVVLVIPRLLAPVLVLPRGVWAALAFLVLGLAQYPAMRTQARLAQPTRKISFERFLRALLLGLVVAALISFAFRAIGLGPY
jgi:uncharacterized protein YybS (DUF2232 family)